MEQAAPPLHAQALTVEQLQSFVAVVDAGSFSAAARSLRKAQSAVSYHVAALEEQLEVAVFDRSGRLPVLTTEGETMLAHARRVLAAMGGLREASRSLASGLEARLFVALNSLFPPDRLAEAVGELHARYPSVDVSVRMSVPRAGTPNLLREGQAELAVISYLDRCDAFEVEPCTTVELVPVVAPTHPLAKRRHPADDAALQEHVHLMLSEDPTPEVEDVQGFPSTKRWRVNSEDIRLALLRRGLGWARMPGHLVDGDVQRGTLVPLRARRWGGKNSVVDLYVARLRNRTLGPAGRWLWQHLTE
ncbi:MAG: LysR family transcriptional regulator [Myxococcota bacterium]